MSSKIKLLDDINLFWVTRPRASWRIVKTKQVHYWMAHEIESMKTYRAVGAILILYIKGWAQGWPLSLRNAILCCEKLFYINLSWMLTTNKNQSKCLGHSYEKRKGLLLHYISWRYVQPWGCTNLKYNTVLVPTSQRGTTRKYSIKVNKGHQMCKEIYVQNTIYKSSSWERVKCKER